MFYGSDYDQSTRAVNLNCVKNGKDKAIIDSGVGGYLISESGVPYYTKNVNQETQSSDVFTISDKMKTVLISQQVLSINEMCIRDRSNSNPDIFHPQPRFC